MKIDIKSYKCRFKKYRFILIPLIIIIVKLSYAQNLSVLENNNSSLQSNQANLLQSKDSLESVLEAELNKLDGLKESESSSSVVISQQMARTFTLSQRLDAINVELEDLQEKIQSIQTKLRQQYSMIIDSLTQVMNDTESGSKKNALHQKLMVLSGKRLRLMPLLSMLSFDIQKVEQYDPESISDSLENIFYQNYLQLALADLDSHITNLQKQEEQLAENLRLQQKKEMFLDDISDSYMFGIEQQAASDPSAIAGPGKDYLEGRFNTPENQQIDNYLHLINQMHTSLILSGASVESNTNVNIDQYVDMLKKTRGILEQYKKMIKNKLNKEVP